MHVPSSFYIVYGAPTAPKESYLKPAYSRIAEERTRRLDQDEDGLCVVSYAVSSFGQGEFESMEPRVPGDDYHETWRLWRSETPRAQG